MNKDNVIYFIIGASATGKSTIVKKICEDFHLEETKSRTERPRGWPHEDTHMFVSPAQADREYNSSDALFQTEISGSRYYTLPEDLRDFYIIDAKGIQDIKATQQNFKYKIILLKTPFPIRLFRIIFRDGFIKGIRRLFEDKKIIGDIEEHVDIVASPRSLYNMFKNGTI